MVMVTVMAVNLGNDSDTVGAVYGQLAGAFYGEREIPAEWLSKLVLKDTIKEMAENLLALSYKRDKN
jgi:ADP-ribosyl-[dinitrogen reductase] hydrolase